MNTKMHFKRKMNTKMPSKGKLIQNAFKVKMNTKMSSNGKLTLKCISKGK